MVRTPNSVRRTAAVAVLVLAIGTWIFIRFRSRPANSKAARSTGSAISEIAQSPKPAISEVASRPQGSSWSAELKLGKIDPNSPIPASVTGIEKELKEALRASELKRSWNFVWPERNGASDVIIVIAKAQPEEIAKLSAELDACLDNSSGKDDLAWRAKLKAELLDHLSYRTNNRTLSIGFPYGPSQPVYNRGDADEISIEPKTGIMHLGGRTASFRMTEEQAIKRYGHLFQMKSE